MVLLRQIADRVEGGLARLKQQLHRQAFELQARLDQLAEGIFRRITLAELPARQVQAVEHAQVAPVGQRLGFFVELVGQRNLAVAVGQDGLVDHRRARQARQIVGVGRVADSGVDLARVDVAEHGLVFVPGGAVGVVLQRLGVDRIDGRAVELLGHHAAGAQVDQGEPDAEGVGGRVDRAFHVDRRQRADQQQRLRGQRFARQRLDRPHRVARPDDGFELVAHARGADGLAAGVGVDQWVDDQPARLFAELRARLREQLLAGAGHRVFEADRCRGDEGVGWHRGRRGARRFHHARRGRAGGRFRRHDAGIGGRRRGRGCDCRCGRGCRHGCGRGCPRSTARCAGAAAPRENDESGQCQQRSAPIPTWK